MPETQKRFVVLHHVTREGEHWDLMLDIGDGLATWQLLADPCRVDAIGATLTGRRIADHRLAYLDYEGPIAGDRGSVTRVDTGSYDLLEMHPDRWIVALHGSNITRRLSVTGFNIGMPCEVIRIG